VIFAVRHRLNSKLAVIIARPDVGRRSLYNDLWIKKTHISIQILASPNAAGIPISGKAC
jgi:hypothetical protein